VISKPSYRATPAALLRKAWLLTLAVIGAAVAPSNTLAAEQPELTECFAAFDPNSGIRISYPDWDFVLSSTVLDVGPSHRFTGRRKMQVTGTRITQQNTSPSWLEGNRVAYDQLSDDGIGVITDFRRMMEHLPDEVALARLTRDEQLAYWLNLYNATLYEQIALAYPRPVVRDLDRGENKKAEVFGEKLLTVAGVPLSLDDIQFGILLPLWQDPLVIYGFYQGAIGGPNIRRHAFTGAAVRRQLSDNAAEFVNSIRGVQKAGDKARVSALYDWNRALFPDFERDLKRHLLAYADSETREILTETDGLRADYFDWGPTDFHNGHPSDIRMYPTVLGSANALFGGSGSIAAASSDFGETSTQGSSIPEARWPPHTLRFFRALRVKFEVFGFPETNIEIEELGTRPDAEGSETAKPEEPNKPKSENPPE